VHSGRVSFPEGPPIAVFPRLSAHVRETLHGDPWFDMIHATDLVIHPGCISIGFKKWLVHRKEDGLVVQQRTDLSKCDSAAFRLGRTRSCGFGKIRTLPWSY
jgi:hypothetical protein